MWRISSLKARLDGRSPGHTWLRHHRGTLDTPTSTSDSLAWCKTKVATIPQAKVLPPRNSTWSILIHPDPSWSILIHPDPSWSFAPRHEERGHQSMSQPQQLGSGLQATLGLATLLFNALAGTQRPWPGVMVSPWGVHGVSSLRADSTWFLWSRLLYCWVEPH